MTQTTQFTIGTEVSCSDGICGELSRVVVDPVARALTHLVVEPKHRHGLGRLVPLSLADAAAAGAAPDEIRLHCTLAEFGELEAAEETHFLPGSSGYGPYGSEQALSWPYYGLGFGGSMGIGLGGGRGLEGMGLGNVAQAVTYDNVPLDEVEVRRGEHVHASDGSIGRVQGLIIDPRDHHVTHVLLQEGHLWGRREVAIPITAITGVDDGIQLSITKQQVQDLPPVDVNHPAG
jgi:sporulation protein YlmC with PRC-barrel domain